MSAGRTLNVGSMIIAAVRQVATEWQKCPIPILHDLSPLTERGGGLLFGCTVEMLNDVYLAREASTPRDRQIWPARDHHCRCDKGPRVQLAHPRSQQSVALLWQATALATATADPNLVDWPFDLAPPGAALLRGDL